MLYTRHVRHEEMEIRSNEVLCPVTLITRAAWQMMSAKHDGSLDRRQDRMTTVHEVGKSGPEVRLDS